MKKFLLFFILLGLAAALYAQQLPLKEVIERSARNVEGALQEGTTVAVVNFTSPSEVFSDHIIEELTGELVSGKKVVIVERRNLELIREEMNIQLSGDVSDESMLSIGKQLGAHYIVSGSLTNMGRYYRFRVKVINVETTGIQTQISLNLKNDSQVTFLIADNPESFSGSVFFGRQKWTIGTGIEMNMNSTEDAAVAFGENFGFNYNINSSLAVGLNVGLSISEIIVFETAALFRWYFLNKYLPVFIQADAGLWASTMDDVMFLAGASAGIRLPIARNFYIEPYARVGYPFMFGAGVAAGIRLPFIKGNAPVGGMTPRAAPVRKTEQRETEPVKEEVIAEEVTFAEEVAAILREFNDDHIWLEFDSDGRLRLMVSVVFSANSAEFEGLSPEIMASNERTLRYVADILKRTKYSSIIIEGHSNPTTPEGPARVREENELRLLSRLRALTVVDELRQHGVNLDRRNVQGEGSSRLAAPYNDPQNNWKNRRVEFILIQ